MVDKETPTETPGKLPIDVDVKPDDDENVDIRSERREPKEATKEAVEAPEKPTEPKKEEGAEEAPPPEKLYSEKELQERLVSAVGGHKGTVTKLQTDMKAMQTKYAALEEQRETAGWDAFIKSVEEDGGDVNKARQLAEREKTSSKRQRDLDAKELLIEEKTALLNEAGRQKTATELVTTYQLGEDTLAKLLEAENPTEMENMALKLAVTKGKIEAKPPEKPSKDVTTTRGKDLSGMKIEERIGKAIEGEI